MESKINSQDIDLQSVAWEILCEFLEVAFHLILYVREIYPLAIFERRKKYNVPVQMSCHPELNQYISDVLKGLRFLLQKGQVERVVLTVSNKEYKPLERFVFEIGQLEETTVRHDSYLLHLESSLRAFLLKINVCDTLLSPNPPDCTFSILVYTKNSSALELEQQQISEEFPWVHADSETIVMEDAIIIPLKSLSSGILKMQLFVEECGKKESLENANIKT